MKKLIKIIGNILGFTRRHWMKIAIAGVVLVVAAVILNHDIASSWLCIFGLAALAYAAVGAILALLSGLANQTKKLGKKVSKSFGKAKNTITGGSAKRTQKKNNDDIITLHAANGEYIDFIEIAGIAYRGNFYAILQPVKLLEGMGSDEALVFKVTRNAKGEDNFEIELDDNIIDAVFKEYNRLLDEQARK